MPAALGLLRLKRSMRQFDHGKSHNFYLIFSVLCSLSQAPEVLLRKGNAQLSSQVPSGLERDRLVASPDQCTAGKGGVSLGRVLLALGRLLYIWKRCCPHLSC